jgi:glucose-1-phosphate adenylyltransferase
MINTNGKLTMNIHKDVISFILAGGIGSRLSPLTRDRAKPAVPFGGKYRIIDFTLANCLHSGLRRVLVLTQYKSHSLQKHLRDGWSIFNPELGEYITTVPAQMRTGSGWYTGTADAIYQNQYLLERSEAKLCFILSGDHIYRMDYAAMMAAHQTSGAELTIACMEVPINEASAFGVVTVDDKQRIIAFSEKPANPEPLPNKPDMAFVSMGIYLFSSELLITALDKDHNDSQSQHDFGHDIIPQLIRNNTVHAYSFGNDTGRVTPDRYWRDVGSIDALYQANMDLLEPLPSLNLYQKDWPIRSYQQQTPPARTVPGATGTEGIFINSILAGGTIIAGGSVQHSILFSEVFVDDEAMIEDAILFEGVHVGPRALLRRCIVDKNVCIPADEKIGYDLVNDRKRFTVSEDGIVVIPKGFRFE